MNSTAEHCVQSALANVVVCHKELNDPDFTQSELKFAVVDSVDKHRSELKLQKLLKRSRSGGSIVLFHEVSPSNENLAAGF